MPTFERGGILFNYEVEGEGPPLVMLHGLGADLTQPRSLLGELDGCQRIFVDCRAHGKTAPLGPENLLNFDQIGDDVVNVLASMDVEYPILGGISMGAAVSANIAVRYPGFPRALVLVRPAWLEEPNPPNLAIFVAIARLLRERGAENGRREFIISDEYQRMKEVAPAVADSLLGQFDVPLAAERCARLLRIPGSRPVVRMADCRRIECPAWVVVTDTDPVHPLEHGRVWADALPSAQLTQITAKSVSSSEHVRQFRQMLKHWIDQKFSHDQQARRSQNI